MSDNISIDQLGDAIIAQLNTFEKKIGDGLRTAVDETMVEMVRDTRSNAQSRTGTYKRHLGSEVKNNTQLGYSRVWRAKSPEYRSVHLLNNGHKLRNGTMYPGNQHVTNARERAVRNFERRIEEVIRDAGSES